MVNHVFVCEGVCEGVSIINRCDVAHWLNVNTAMSIHKIAWEKRGYINIMNGAGSLLQKAVQGQCPTDRFDYIVFLYIHVYTFNWGTRRMLDLA